MEEVELSDQAHTSNLMEVDLSVGVLAETIYPVLAPMQRSEITGVVEAVAEAELEARVIEAEQQFVLAKEKLFALETKITPLLMGRKKFHEKCGGGLLLLNCHSNLALVTDPVQKDAIPIEEPINNNNNSEIVASKRIVRKRRRLISSLNM
ncbi:hypothetical protein MKW98_000885 [Papaver atlanticum]|uniref:Uncharacterized protein n=1 Tax=Papaver atlanticum TaxID=357466 RepID=A0AAD4SEZ7_9MAGN|nr:hypothetical protein MKW98_000885 [Papaver atlanticum]